MGYVDKARAVADDAVAGVRSDVAAVLNHVRGIAARLGRLEERVGILEKSRSAPAKEPVNEPVKDDKK